MKRGIEGHQWSKLRRLGSKKDEGLNRLQVGGFAPPITTADVAGTSSSAATAATATATATAAMTTTMSGHALTVSEFISRFDEVARRRLNSMNEKLRGLEMQMESFEAEMHKANDPSIWS